MRAKLPHTEGFVDRDGVRIHYEIYGDGEHTMLFLPTWQVVHSRVYKAQIPYFSDRFRVIAYDPRGNGRSDRPATRESYNLEALVGDALAVLDAAGVERAIILGYSTSVSVGSALAAYHPDRVEAFIGFGAFTPQIAPSFSYQRVPPPHPGEPHEGWQKLNPDYWRASEANYADFCAFFIGEICNESHSSKQIEDCIAWAAEGDGDMLGMSLEWRQKSRYLIDEEMFRRIACPVLLVHGARDAIAPLAMSEKIAELTGGDLHVMPQAGHGPHGRFPAEVNTRVRDFLAEKLGTWEPRRRARPGGAKRALYLSSPIGLGHARRDLAIARELRRSRPGLQVDWLAQDPVTRFLAINEERVHGASALLANESQHIEEEAGEHDLNAFQALRNMDEILIRNFMVFQEVIESETFDLVIADEAWDVDHFWHEHPNFKKTQMAWLTDFVGWAPMPDGGAREAMLTTDYNAEMIGHVEGCPALRDRAIFVGNPRDIAPLSFGRDLPDMRDWTPKHFEFSGYVMGQHPETFGPRDELREKLGYRSGEKVCIVTVGGSGVGLPLIRRILAAFPIARRRMPDLTMTVVTGPRIDPAAIAAQPGLTVKAFVPDLDRHLAACDLALVQGGLTTCMELTAAGTPFLYFPLQNHFEQNIHVAHRLEGYGAGRRMIYGESDPDDIAAAMVAELASPRGPSPVESDGAARVAAMLAELL
ncbi:alpha/beta fold hydrolase [Phenylobacterium sp.]|uniref:alpha/beta hydrolase n=1 Tax=Phenylobacterium sp. TaxID=1871053 RepID=UPI00356308D0